MRFLLVVLAALSSALASALPENLECPGGHLETTTSFIGKDSNVRVDRTDCIAASSAAAAEPAIAKRQSNNVCGAQCNTNCFIPSGGGPDPNECHVISDALLFDSENVGALFQLNPAANGSVITMQFRSCKSFMVNQDNVTLTYCRTDWSSVLDFVAFNCQSQQNAHGGNCVAADQRWFIQVQHS